MTYFADRRDALLAALEADRARSRRLRHRGAGPGRRDRRDPSDLPRRAREAVGIGATHVILGMPPRLGAAGVDDVAREIAEPLRAALG